MVTYYENFVVNIVTRYLVSLYLFGLALILFSIVPAKADDFLDPELAFKVSTEMVEPGMAEVRFSIAKGYYLYKEQLKFSSIDAKLLIPKIPPGKIKFDETFQKNVETFRNSLIVRVPLQTESDFTMVVGMQGCADQGLCYPPMETTFKLSVLDNDRLMTKSQSGASSLITPLDVSTDSSSNDNHSISSALKSGRWVVILPLFFILGLGLSFTPCVLPMVPILSFIIVGEGVHIKRSRSFTLSLSYSLGMALVYTALGVAAGLAGEGLAAFLQNPWILGSFALAMVILSLSMFGVYQLQMPGVIQTRLTLASEGQRNGKLIGVFLMGSISALIVGPCVAAPLAGALVYISQTRDVVIGGSALFAMAMGMSIPLLLVGVSAGSLLPRAGAWMDSIKRFFGVLMLAMAIWMITPLIPGWVQMICWATLFLGYGIYQFSAHRQGFFSKSLSGVFVIFGLIQLVGVSSGGRDVYAPLAHLFGTQKQGVRFVRVNTIADLEIALAQAKGKVVLLDFYADWCISCKEMEKLTFTNSLVKEKLNKMLLLQVDVTANNAADKALLKQFLLFGPPGIIFFDKQGLEILGGRVIGYQNDKKFLKSLSWIESR